MGNGFSRKDIAALRRAKSSGALEQQKLRAVLGDGQGRVDVTDRRGYVYVRYPAGADENNFEKYTAPVQVRVKIGAGYLRQHGMTVYVGKGPDGADYVMDGDWVQTVATGVNPAVTNPLNKESLYFTSDTFIPLLSTPVATSNTPGTKVQVRDLFYENENGDLIYVPATATEAQKLDLSSYIPSAGQHRYAVVWLDTFDNTLKVSVSTSKSIFTPLTTDDVSECGDNRPADAIPIKAYYLKDAQTTIRAHRDHVDLRQLINTPPLLGYENPITKKTRLWANRHMVTKGTLTVKSTLTVLGTLWN